jgi:hypothetical protein
MINLLRNIANLWSFSLLLAAAATLLWFVYSVFLRKVVRAKRISSARSKRLLREASERTPDTFFSI